MKQRFYVAGTHIFDKEDQDWIPQAGTHVAARRITEKLNSLNHERECPSLSWLHNIDDELAILEDTIKGPEGDKLTQIRKEINARLYE